MNDVTPTETEVAEPEAGNGAVVFEGTFEELGLPEGVLAGLKDLGYLRPTKVQAEVFKPVFSGEDTVVQSRTGSGKTTAFCLPVISRIDPEVGKVQAIALAPTRELALQVAREAGRLGNHHGVKIAAVYGGASMNAQIDALKGGAQFVVGTPGRVADLIRRGHLKLKNVRFAVLDEADEMLSMGFWDEVTGILDRLPKERQTLLFSATLPNAIERAARVYLTDPARVDLSGDAINVSTIRHVVHMVDESMSQPRQLLYAIEMQQPQSAIVFCNRRGETEMICAYLRRFGFRAEALNGDLPQRARERVLAKVKAGELDMMVATDVAARGIDISDLGHVFNYDLPEYDEVYIHRVGRTGRIGKKGTAISMVRGRYLTHLSTLKRTYNVPFEEVALPAEKEILWMQAERLATKLVEDADGVEVGQYRDVANSMLERGDAQEIVAYLLRSYFAAAPKAPAPERRDDRRSRDDRGERGDRGERRPRDEDRGPRTARLYISLGRDHGYASLEDLGAVLAEIAGIDKEAFNGRGDLRGHSSHIELLAEHAEAVAEAVHGKPYPEGTQEAYAAAKAAEAEARAADEDGEEESDKPAREERPRPTELVCELARSKRRPQRRRRRR